MSAVVVSRDPDVSDITEWKALNLEGHVAPISMRHGRGVPWQLCSVAAPMDARVFRSHLAPDPVIKCQIAKPDVDRFLRYAEELAEKFGVDGSRMLQEGPEGTAQLAVKTTPQTGIFISDNGVKFRRTSVHALVNNCKVVPVVRVLAWKRGGGAHPETGLRIVCVRLLIVPEPEPPKPELFRPEDLITEDEVPPEPSAPAAAAAVPFVEFVVDAECCICIDAAPTKVFHPCGHKCCCATCAEKIAAGNKTCPICRAEITA